MVGKRLASRAAELEVARNRRSKARNAPYTVTVMFKDPPAEMDAEAWRILRHVVKGKELMLDHVRSVFLEGVFLESAAIGACASAAAAAPVRH